MAPLDPDSAPQRHYHLRSDPLGRKTHPAASTCTQHKYHEDNGEYCDTCEAPFEVEFVPDDTPARGWQDQPGTTTYDDTYANDSFFDGTEEMRRRFSDMWTEEMPSRTRTRAGGGSRRKGRRRSPSSRSPRKRHSYESKPTGEYGESKGYNDPMMGWCCEEPPPRSSYRMSAERYAFHQAKLDLEDRISRAKKDAHTLKRDRLERKFDNLTEEYDFSE